jgi:hypothetical protein
LQTGDERLDGLGVGFQGDRRSIRHRTAPLLGRYDAMS